MKIERAIEILNPNHRERYDGIGTVNEACRMGIKALEKLNPMEVTDAYTDGYYCPACGAENGRCHSSIDDKYCPRCGQALRWKE